MLQNCHNLRHCRFFSSVNVLVTRCSTKWKRTSYANYNCLVTWLSLNTSFTSAIWVVLVGAFIDGVIDLFRPFRYFLLVGLFVLFMLVGLFEPNKSFVTFGLLDPHLHYLIPLCLLDHLCQMAPLCWFGHSFQFIS